MWATFKRLKLYILAIPAFCFLLGAGLNQVVMIANHDKFPVMVNQVRTRTEENPQGLQPGDMIDSEHVVMQDSDHFKYLADIFDFGSIYSVGDGFSELGEYGWSFLPLVWVYAICRKVQDESK